MASWLDALFGRLFDGGTELPLRGGMNFIGFTIEADAANNRYNITAPSGGASTSDDVSNESGVSGATVTDALDALEAAIVGGGTPTTRVLTAGAGLTGGGDLTADRTFDIVAGDATITVNANSIQVGTLVSGNFANNTIALARLANASAQFQIVGRKTASGGAWEDCSAAELGLVPTSRTITAGTGLTGGGDLSANRTITLGTVANSNLADNTIALARLVNAGAQNRILCRASSGSGAWEDSSNIPAFTITALTCTTINGVTVAAPVEGTALTDANQTLNVSGGNNYVQSTALTASRTKTLGTSGSPETGEIITITRTTTAAFTMPIVNGGGGGGTLYTFPSGGKRVADFRYDGTNWVLAGVKRLT